MAVLSFAHLKRKSVAAVQGEKVVEPADKVMVIPTRTTYRIPSVMPSALIHRVNYCASGNAPCPRYLPATEHDKTALQIKYGQCLREVKSPESILGEEPIMVEVWKNIPESATVSKCYFNQKEKS